MRLAVNYYMALQMLFSISPNLSESCSKIGEVRIDKIMGPKISLCKVNKGGEDILRIINEGKITLRLVSRKAKLFDD